jgi:signal transduction histidine kinase/CheY-like chemotaxis protein/integral membrane sensor domain MASE1
MDMEPAVRHPFWLLRNLAAAAAYMATAVPAFYFADPVVPATSVFPPAGIALAVLLVWGWRIVGGVLLGCLLVNLAVLEAVDGPWWQLLPAALVISMASTLQAVIGSQLAHRYAREGAGSAMHWNKLRLILIGGPLVCGIAAAVGSVVHMVLGRIAVDHVPFNFLTWWVGDSLGVMLFAPLVLIPLRQLDEGVARWWRLLIVPVVALGFVLLLFFLVNLREQLRVEAIFREQAREVTEHINLRLNGHAETLHSLRRFWRSSRNVDAQEFHEFIGDALKNQPDIRLLAWAPASGNQIRLGFVEPTGLQTLAGYDLMSNPVLREPLRQARDSGSLIVVPGPARLPDRRLRKGVLMVEPIYAAGLPQGSVAARRAAFLGVAVGAFELLPAAQAAATPVDQRLLLTVADVTDPEPLLLHEDAGAPDRKPLELQTKLDAGQRQWLVTVTAPQGYRAAHRTHDGILVLTGGLMLAAFLQALVLALRRSRDWELQSLRAERARDQAEQEARVKGAFLATMSHEIRTPMNGVIGMTQLLADTRLDNEQQHYVSTIRQSCEALLRILNDILDFSKIEAGRMQIENVVFPLRTLLEECCELFSPHSRQSGIPLKLEIGEGVPAEIVGDPVRIRQVLINLLGNAFKFTREGSITVRVGRRDTDGLAVLRFEVQDTGIGIADVQRARLFESFAQGDSTITRKYGGTGLGLSICRLLVDLMGGKIGVHTAHGKGSMFWFSVPLQAVTGGSLQEPVAPGPEQPAAPLMNGLRALVVEDNLVNQQVISGFLRKQGVTPRVVVDGVEALHVLTTERQVFDAIFMDCEMPNMDGYTATERIRQWERAERLPPVFICGVSAHVIKEYRERALTVGMDDFIAKPLQREELMRVLEILKAQHSLPQALAP